MLPAGDPHAGQPVLRRGPDPAQARRAVILIHGRGDSAAGILTLADAIDVPDVAWVAPQAAGNTWYPYPFLAPMSRNEPGLSSALRVIGTLVTSLLSEGLGADRIVLMGFSQGACLSLEFAARNARRLRGGRWPQRGLDRAAGQSTRLRRCLRRYTCVSRLQRYRSAHSRRAGARVIGSVSQDGSGCRRTDLPAHGAHRQSGRDRRGRGTATSLKANHRETENTEKLFNQRVFCDLCVSVVEFQRPYICVRRYDRRFRSCRATFQTSPQRTQRQYEASVTVLLVVMMSLERHSGQLVGGGAACGSGSERN